MSFVVVTSLLGVVDQHFLQPNPLLDNNILDDSQIAVSLSNKLRSLQAFLEESEIQPVDEALDSKIRDVAVEAEAKMESKLREVYLASSNNNGDLSVEACRGLRQTLQYVVKDIESLESRIKIHKESLPPVKEPSTPPAAAVKAESTVISGPTHHNLASGNEMIGCEDQFQKIKEMLIHRYSQREVIAVTGMGGIGKTTLARRVYEDPEIKSFFDISAWTVVSQHYSVKEILLRLLGCIVSMTSEIYKKDDGELADQLRRSLMGQRYLIVVDDIWDAKAWNDIQDCFPDNMNASRILITTRNDDVAKYVDRFSKYTHKMRFLNPEESWELFSSKVFKRASPQLKIESIGRKIVDKCQGLPLTIVVTAGLLVNLERSPKQWENFAQNIMESQSVPNILELSYNNLPVHLRACFLYLAIFPEDTDIPVKKLIKLWVAEGFLKSEMSKSLEEVAEVFLWDLITRNLVQVVKRSVDGKIKSCRLHDMLRHFGLRKAQEENMVVVIDEYHDDDLAITKQSSKLGCHWVRCKSLRWPITPSNSSSYNCGKTRSILYFGKDLYLAKCEFQFPCLRLLRVLDLSLIKYWNGMPNGIVDLIHLRYLALTTTGSLYNIQLFKLQNLQTLILFSWKKECHLHLPCEILDFPWLRHVHLDKGSLLHLPKSIQGNLQTLFWLKLTSWDDTKTPDFTRVPNLKALGIYIEGKLSFDALDSLAQLHQLEKLKFEAGRVESFSLPNSFPPNINKLSFCKTYLPWEEMDVIGKLPNLEVLKLKDFAFCGPEWEPSEGGFEKLKLLLIARSDLKHWVASDEHFPVLKLLVLKYCWNLVNIPSEFAYISTLESIELESCYSSLAKSAEEIKFEQQECGNELHVRKLGIKDKMSEHESETEEEDSE